MAGVLSCCGAWGEDQEISFLIVATGQLCEKIFEVIRTATKDKYRVSVHQCESVLDIVNSSDFGSGKPQIHADFIVFAFDERISSQVAGVENSIAVLDEFYVIAGRVLLVNCYGSPNTMGLTCHAATALREKYCLQVLSANIYTEQGLASLGDKLLNYTESLMGLKTGIPNLNMLANL